MSQSDDGCRAESVCHLSLLIIHTDVTRSVSCHAQLGGRVSLLCPDVGRSKELWAGPNMNMCPSRVLSVRGKAIHASLLHKKCPYKTLAMSVSHFNVGVTVWIWHNLLHTVLIIKCIPYVLVIVLCTWSQLWPILETIWSVSVPIRSEADKWFLKTLWPSICPTTNNSFCQDSQRKYKLWKTLRTTSSLRAMTAKKWQWQRLMINLGPEWELEIFS